MSLAAVLLAGGTSSRMGSPKALLAAPGRGPAETFLDRLIRVAGTAASPVIVVLGHEPERILAGLVRQGEAVFVVNGDYRQGQLSSLQCGLRAVPTTAAGVLFTPVDLPDDRSRNLRAAGAGLRGRGGQPARGRSPVPRAQRAPGLLLP